MRLIDADELRKQMKELHEKRDEEANMTGDRAVCVTWHDAVIFIKNAPTIDAVPVVRCKDCKWFERKYSIWADRAYTECSYLEAPMVDDDYCSCGERREDE